MYLLKRVYSFATPYRDKFYISIFLSIFLAVMAPVRPYLTQLAINKGITEETAANFLTGPGSFLIEITIIQIVLLLIETMGRFYFTFTSAALGQNVVKDMRIKTYRKILGLQLRQYDKTPIGTLTTRTINDIESVNDIFSDGLIPIIADLLAIFSVLGYMFYIDWQLTLVCLSPFPFLIVATYYFKESVNRSFIKVRNAVASLNAFVQEHISGMSLVQAFAAEDREMKQFRKINKDHRDANIRAIFAYSVFFPIVELISALSIGLLVWWAGNESLFGSDAAKTPGVITSFILCLNLLFRPLRVLADKFNVMQMGMIASERVFKVMDNKDAEIDKGKETGPIDGKVSFRNVWFAYKNEEWVLKNISFDVAAGETLAIVGATGSGKTSTINLLTRLYPLSKGEIFVDGRNIEEYSLDYLRSKIGVVLQDVFLFAGTVMDNLTLRNPDITEQQVYQATRHVGLHDFILQLPGGYNYNVMERGATLSVGQRQLLSFARALLYDPSVLILDEATSSVDPDSERLIQSATDALITGRTSIVIAHRLSTIRKADKIIVMNKGEIVEMGSHQKLLASNGPYARLYAMQFQPEAQ
ncbi:MAG: ABC transporter ATP-binding protein [Chitinophagaceae bacterium]|nr:MAG: ABC transporter ATP-binding protein [Chitinophagaceae bacterium]